MQSNKLYSLIIKFIVSLISVCLLLEGALRLFAPEAIIPAHTVPAFGNPNAWKKNISFKAKNPLNKFYTATINKNHLRSLKDFSYEKPEKTIRIMGFGNSIMWGSHVNDNETFGHYLENILNRQIDTNNFEFLNVGKGGWDLVNQLIYLKNEGYKYSPDLIVLFRPQNEYHFLNLSKIDFSKMRYKKTNLGKFQIILEGIKPKLEKNFLVEKLVRRFDKVPFYFKLTKMSQLLNRVRKKTSYLWSTGWLNNIESQHKLENFIKSLDLKNSDQVEWIIENVPYKPIFRNKSFHLSQFIKGDNNIAEIQLILYQWFTNQIIDFAKEKNAKVLVVETPRDNQILDIFQFSNSTSYFQPQKNLYFKRLLSEMISFQKRSSSMLLFPNDVHFTPSGNHLAALIIYNFIIENQIFPNNEPISQIDLFSPKLSNLVHLSNESIKNEIKTLRYSSYLKGWNHFINRRFSKAEKDLLDYLKVNKNEYATFLLCKSYLSNHKNTKAKNCLYSLSKGFFLTQLKYQYLVELHLKSLETEKAFKILNEWINQYPLETNKSSIFYFLTGKAFWQAKESDSAKLYLETAAHKAPKDYLIILTLASFYFSHTNYEESILTFKQASKLNPGTPIPYLFLSMANFKVGNTEDGNLFIREFIIRCGKNCEKIIEQIDLL